MPQAPFDRTAAIAGVRDELGDVVRLGTARARSQVPGLTFVDVSILNALRAAPGSRITDLAVRFALDKSTVSRQVKALASLGLIEAGDADPSEPGAQRGRPLALTAAGRAERERAASALLNALEHRLADWSDADIATFGRLLERFNGERTDT